MAQKQRRLVLRRITVVRLGHVAGGPNHRTTNNYCTYNAWESCYTFCGTCGEWSCNPPCETECGYCQC